MGPTKWWQWVLVYPTLVISIGGAIPQFLTWIKAYKLDVPSNAVHLAIDQGRLWEKNFSCPKDKVPGTVKTPRNDTLEVIVCPSGDILVKVMQPDKPDPYYRWIAFDTFTTRGSHLVPTGQKAYAEEISLRLDMLAQPGSMVICQGRDHKGFVIRVIRLPSGQCQEEVINPYTGRVVSVRSAPCISC